MLIKKLQKNKGFVILYAVTLAAILLSIALGVANIALKEVKFGTSAKDTNNAFFAADAGVECGLVSDKSATSLFTTGNATLTCNGVSNIDARESPASFWTFVLDMNSTKQGCAKVTVDKTIAANTTIIAKGKNISDALCSTTSANTVERELKTSYRGSATTPPTPTPETPCQSTSTCSTPSSLAVLDYNVGYNFTVNKSGTISALWINMHDSLTHTVRLFDSFGTLVGSAVVTAGGVGNVWVQGTITPVSVSAGSVYTVAVRVGPLGTIIRSSNVNGTTVGSITINNAFRSSLPSSDLMPTIATTGNIMNGLVDITFTPN